jgi:hypothetical protein
MNAARSTLKIAAVALVLVCVFVFSYQYLFPTVTLKYRLALHAEAAGQKYVASSVIQVTRQDTRAVFGSLGGVGSKIKGEAVALNFGSERILFGILRSGGGSEDWAAWLPLAVLQLPASNDPIAAIRKLKTLKGPREVPHEHWPMLVRFRDLQDQTSVERVIPPDLSPWFGLDARLTSVTLEMTDDEVTPSIDRWLPWLEALRGAYLGNAKISSKAPLGLTGLDFKRG